MAAVMTDATPPSRAETHPAPLRDDEASSSIRLSALPTAPSLARRHTRRVLAGWQLGVETIDTAVLLVSELATNAVLHSRSRLPGGVVTVHARLDGQRLRVEVGDQGGSWQSPSSASPDEQNGRGLLIVGRLASRWGCEGHSRYGWTVWFELETGR
jgi:anti-sigma regulatory factor (Ser/Thr protein kinase)